MCRQCGCAAFIRQGPEATLKQTIAIIKELGVTAENVQRFEDGERICGIIASRLPAEEDAEIRQMAEWFAEAHAGIYAMRNRDYARAAREIFAGFPAEGSPLQVMSAWHQLEELTRDMGDEVISSAEEESVQEAIRAVRRVHDNREERRAELLKRYGIEAP